MSSEVEQLVAGFSDISDWAWEHYLNMDAKAGHLGNQMVRAMDSIGANICEGYGREYPGSVLQFYRYAKGSGLEAAYWLDRAISRKLIPIEQGMPMLKSLTSALSELDVMMDALPKKGDRV